MVSKTHLGVVAVVAGSAAFLAGAATAQNTNCMVFGNIISCNGTSAASPLPNVNGEIAHPATIDLGAIAGQVAIVQQERAAAEAERARAQAEEERRQAEAEHLRAECESAWKIDPLTGDIGVQK